MRQRSAAIVVARSAAAFGGRTSTPTTTSPHTFLCNSYYRDCTSLQQKSTCSLVKITRPGWVAALVKTTLKEFLHDYLHPEHSIGKKKTCTWWWSSAIDRIVNCCHAGMRSPLSPMDHSQNAWDKHPQGVRVLT